MSEYIHKAVGIVGVSAGGFAGARVIQGLLPVTRELGLATIFWDVNIGIVGKVFTEDGRLLDEAVVRRSDRARCHRWKKSRSSPRSPGVTAARNKRW